MNGSVVITAIVRAVVESRDALQLSCVQFFTDLDTDTDVDMDHRSQGNGCPEKLSYLPPSLDQSLHFAFQGQISCTGNR